MLTQRTERAVALGRKPSSRPLISKENNGIFWDSLIPKGEKLLFAFFKPPNKKLKPLSALGGGCFFLKSYYPWGTGRPGPSAQSTMPGLSTRGRGLLGLLATRTPSYCRRWHLDPQLLTVAWRRPRAILDLPKDLFPHPGADNTEPQPSKPQSSAPPPPPPTHTSLTPAA